MEAAIGSYARIRRSAQRPAVAQSPSSEIHAVHAPDALSRARHVALAREIQPFAERVIILITTSNNGKVAFELVEVGCGCLRIAYWLVRFLDPGCYYGIEPARLRVEYGLQYLFKAGEVQLKRPRFDFNPRFDTSVFGAQFDFFLARSIWTHASKLQIVATLDSFIRDSKDTGVFLVSYLPARIPDEDYRGDR